MRSEQQTDLYSRARHEGLRILACLGEEREKMQRATRKRIQRKISHNPHRFDTGTKRSKKRKPRKFTILAKHRAASLSCPLSGAGEPHLSP